jgi:signal transduction histidine kinase
MKERAAQVNGKLQVVSKPSQGTKIVITVRRDQYAHPAKNKR